MTIEDLKKAQDKKIPIAWEWSGLDMIGTIEGFLPPDQVLIKWKMMESKDMRFQEYMSIIPAALFKEEQTDKKPGNEYFEISIDK